MAGIGQSSVPSSDQSTPWNSSQFQMGRTVSIDNHSSIQTKYYAMSDKRFSEQRLIPEENGVLSQNMYQFTNRLQQQQQQQTGFQSSSSMMSGCPGDKANYMSSLQSSMAANQLSNAASANFNMYSSRLGADPGIFGSSGGRTGIDMSQPKQQLQQGFSSGSSRLGGHLSSQFMDSTNSPSSYLSPTPHRTINAGPGTGGAPGGPNINIPLYNGAAQSLSSSSASSASASTSKNRTTGPVGAAYSNFDSSPSQWDGPIGNFDSADFPLLNRPKLSSQQHLADNNANAVSNYGNYTNSIQQQSKLSSSVSGGGGGGLSLGPGGCVGGPGSASAQINYQQMVMKAGTATAMSGSQGLSLGGVGGVTGLLGNSDCHHQQQQQHPNQHHHHHHSSEFSIQQEDFPALPVAQNPAVACANDQQQQQRSSSAAGTATGPMESLGAVSMLDSVGPGSGVTSSATGSAQKYGGGYYDCQLQLLHNATGSGSGAQHEPASPMLASSNNSSQLPGGSHKPSPPPLLPPPPLGLATPSSGPPGIGAGPSLSAGGYGSMAATAIPKKIIQGPNNYITNIPNDMVSDAFGLIGLVKLIGINDTHENLNLLAPGLDTLSLNRELSSTRDIFHSYVSPLSSNCAGRPHDMDFPVPKEYRIRHLILDKLADPLPEKLSDETLFWIFYNLTGEECQTTAAKQLFARQWRYNKREKFWLTRDSKGVTEPIIQSNLERGSYIVWDYEKAQRVSKVLTVFYKDLENLTPPSTKSIFPFCYNSPFIKRSAGGGGGGGPASVQPLSTNNSSIVIMAGGGGGGSGPSAGLGGLGNSVSNTVIGNAVAGSNRLVTGNSSSKTNLSVAAAAAFLQSTGSGGGTVTQQQAAASGCEAASRLLSSLGGPATGSAGAPSLSQLQLMQQQPPPHSSPDNSSSGGVGGLITTGNQQQQGLLSSSTPSTSSSSNTSLSSQQQQQQIRVQINNNSSSGGSGSSTSTITGGNGTGSGGPSTTGGSAPPPPPLLAPGIVTVPQQQQQPTQ